MDCERAVEALIDRAAGQLADADASALAEHLASCARCRAEAAEVDGLWNDLAALRTIPAQAHTDRLAAALRPAGPRGAPFLRAALWAALLLGAGWIGRLTAPPSSAPAPAAAGGAEWLLLLHEDPYAPPARYETVAEYTAWADALATEGRLVAAEKLVEGPGLWLPQRPAASRVSGFFIVRAPDGEAAASIARAGPHLPRGGTIEVRRIDNSGGR